MSTSNTHQQSLADAGSETRPGMLERGSYIPWACHFRRYLNRKRENRKWLNKEIDKGPYDFKEFTPSKTEEPSMQKEEDLRGGDLKHYEAEIKAMNLILIFIPNDIYNSLDACITTQAMWQRVEREALVSVCNRFAKLMNDLERNGIIFLKVTQVRLAKRLTEDTYDDLNQAIVQGDRVNIQSRNSGNDGRNTRRSYVQEEIIKGNSVQNDARNIQRTLQTTSSGTAANVQCYNCSEKGHYARN
ncbi:retrovirus-related pol polyprotein from transposon TNT 1-94 [Tanacetum coccineum]